MRDHLSDSTPAPPIQKQVGVRELKAYAARILRQVRDSRASYVLAHRGRAIGVILPLDSAENQSQALDHDSDPTAAWNNFMRAGRRLERRFRRGVSGVRLLSAMRR
jgi:antitoxin (DNA-binding transcriptional repressor) of toxin-antitoxin stability system